MNLTWLVIGSLIWRIILASRDKQHQPRIQWWKRMEDKW